MRELSIITGEDETGPTWHKHTGFVNDRRIGPATLCMLAGWSDTVDACVADSVVLWDEDSDTATTVDGTYEAIGETHLLPNPGESWVFVLGDKLHLS